MSHLTSDHCLLESESIVCNYVQIEWKHLTNFSWEKNLAGRTAFIKSDISNIIWGSRNYFTNFRGTWIFFLTTLISAVCSGGVVSSKRLIHLFLTFEKSSRKNQVRRTGFLVYLELGFCCLCSLQKSTLKLIFVG